jgi:CRP-like cAMP-binding protein
MSTAEFTFENQNFLYGIGQIVEFPVSTRVIRKGETESHFFQVIEGILEIPSDDFLIRLFPGQFFGELGFLSNLPRTNDVISTTPVRLLKIERSEVIEKFASHPDDRETFLATLKSQAENILSDIDTDEENSNQFFNQLAKFAQTRQ